MTRDQNYTPKEQQSLAGQTSTPIKTSTYNDEAAPWKRSSHPYVLGTRLLK
jgi:hypothetical protein